ncbi:MAG: hypothetical protein ABR583_14000 [Gaiellaceae bacterium]
MALAPWRAQRPGAARLEREPPSPDELDSCPFCEGREDRTPPETFALAPPGRPPDTPGWTVRVVPNKYPAFEHHEVVIHTPRHVRSLSELSGAEIAEVAAAWQARADTARAAGFPYLQAVVNEGGAAGGSLAHAHSQLVWLPDVPPLAVGEQGGPCGVCAVLAESERVNGAGGLVLLVPRAGRSPYELMVAPEEHTGDAFAAPETLAAAIRLLADGVGRLHSVEGPVALNAWLHTAAFGGGGHWHFELVPRLSIIASLELGAGIYINSLAPEVAAERLRGVNTPPHVD